MLTCFYHKFFDLKIYLLYLLYLAIYIFQPLIMA